MLESTAAYVLGHDVKMELAQKQRDFTCGVGQRLVAEGIQYGGVVVLAFLRVGVRLSSKGTCL